MDPRSRHQRQTLSSSPHALLSCRRDTVRGKPARFSCGRSDIGNHSGPWELGLFRIKDTFTGTQQLIELGAFEIRYAAAATKSLLRVKSLTWAAERCGESSRPRQAALGRSSAMISWLGCVRVT